MGQLGRTYPRIFRKRHRKFLECFGLFLARTLTLQVFLGLSETSVLIKRKTMTEITCKSYVTHSILFQDEFLYTEYCMSKKN